MCRPAAVIRVVSSLASKTHKTLHYAETDETMVHLTFCLPCSTVLTVSRYPSSNASPTAAAADSATSWAGATTARSTGIGLLGTSSSTSASRRRKV